MTFTYQYAIVCGIPDSYKTNCIRSDSESEIDLEKAHRQHTEYIETLRKLGVSIIELKKDERYPDCVFVEDCAVVINQTAFICKPGAASRVGEEAAVRKALNQLGLRIVEIEDPKGTVEGGDVLFTGREILVGISSRTNTKGADALAKAFPDYPTALIEIPGDNLHLKSVMSMIAEDVIAISNTPGAQHIRKEVQNKTIHAYNVVELDEDIAANVLYVNGMVIHQNQKLIPKSWPVLKSKFDNSIELDCSELAKADGCLTCCSILIQKMHQGDPK